MEPTLLEKKIVKSVSAKKESKLVPGILITITVLFLSLFLLLPLITIFLKAFERGMDVYIAAITDQEAFSAIRLTLLVALIVVPLNTIFGVAAAWLITKFQFKGKQVLLSLIELPFAVSPVIAGLVFVLLFTPRGALGEWLLEHGVKLIFSVPGIIIATIFVTFPFVARELIPIMQAQGKVKKRQLYHLAQVAGKCFGALRFQI